MNSQENVNAKGERYTSFSSHFAYNSDWRLQTPMLNCQTVLSGVIYACSIVF